MKLLRDGEVPAPPAVESHQETAWRALFAGLTLIAASLALAVWPWAENGWQFAWPALLLGLLALIVLLIGRFALRSFLASRQPQSWRLRWDAEGIYLRYRSYLNNRFPADAPAALYLPRREVAWLKDRRETLDGFEARVFQHEYDHLDGVLFHDRMTDEVRGSVQGELDALMDAEAYQAFIAG